MDRLEQFDRFLASLGTPRTCGTLCPPPTRSRDELPAVPDHELIRCIGQGAYGEVWLARTVLGTYRAVKIVFRDSFSSDQPYEREFRGIQRFEPVSRANDGLMDILQVGRNDGQGCFYYVMELADDVAEVRNSKDKIQRCESYAPSTLARVLHQRGRLPASECVQLGLALTSALGHLHRQGLIHRDIKPSNIIFVQGVPKLADIGLVVEVEEAFSFVGTEGYIPPEGPTSPQADLYSLGKVLYEASNGKDRKEYPEPMTDLRELPDRAEQEMVLELNAIILKACAEEARERYQTAEECQADLALIQSGRSVRRRRQLETRVAILTRMALGIGIAALVGFAGYVFQKEKTAVAQQLSEENRQLAEAEKRQRGRAESALLDAHLQRARELLNQKKNSMALTQLGQLPRHSSNRFIAEQILWTLCYRNFALPIARFSDSNGLSHARFSAAGSRIVTASTNGSVRIWDALRGDTISRITIEEGGSRTMQISADREFIATVGRGQVRVVSARTGLVKVIFAGESKIDQIAFNLDSSELLIVRDREVSVRVIQTGELRVGPLEHKAKITSANFSARGNRIITYSQEDSRTYIWDILTGRLISTFEHKPFQTFRTDAVISSDGTRIITVLSTADMPSNALRIWNTATGEALSEVIEFKFPIRSIEISPDGTRFVIGGNGRAAWICDGRTGRRLVGPLEYEAPICATSFSSDSLKVAVADTTGLVRIWDATTGAMIVDSFSRSGCVDFLAFSPNGEQLLVSGRGTARLWDVRNGEAKSKTLQHDASVTFAQFSRDGRRIVTTMDERVFSGQWSRPSSGRSARVWDAQSLEPLAPPLLHARGVITAAFSPDGERVVTTSWDRTAKVWNAKTGGALGEPLRHEGPIRSVAFSQDGKRLWTGSWGHSAWLWNARDGGLIQDLLGNKGEVSEFPFFPIRTDDLSADQQWLVTCSPEGDRAQGLPAMQVWNARTGERRYIRSSLGYTIRTARFSPDGERIVTSSAQARAAHIWNARTGELLVGPLEHKGEVLHSAEFSPDGSKVITAGHDGTARVWNSQTGELIERPMTHKGEVIHAAFSPDSKRVVTASWWDHAAFIWDAETGLQIGETLQHEDWVTYAAFSPDGKWVITTSADKTARVWEVPTAISPIPAWLPELAEAVAGQRLDNGNLEVVPPEKLLELKRQLTVSPETDYYTRFAKWFFADRSTRPQSWSSSPP